ncbi:Aste57867_1717 [Aphanomyces stellatus]|uniref:Vacuolar protein 8 n=1 Tax=Aphanomyces stellatus TaxID=120398 RepID=A0A485K9D0_9STRA|nr:hypothetical protein As57867_001715 [Aphanomyces stellatus]VFT78928.1 Aste57867_1717 [Aphanomyces stellatus]
MDVNNESPVSPMEPTPDNPEADNSTTVDADDSSEPQDDVPSGDSEASPPEDDIDDESPLTPMEMAVRGWEALCETFETTCQDRIDGMMARVSTSLTAMPQLRRWVVERIDTVASLEMQVVESAAKCKTLMSKWTREKEERRAEKEWIADVWPDFIVVPPTILKPFMKAAVLTEDEKKVVADAARMKMRLLEEADNVRARLEQARQWAPVDNYFYNSVTGESSWEQPASMLYVAPSGWDKAKNQWKAGVVLTLGDDVVQPPSASAAAVPPTQTTLESARTDVDASDSEVDAQLDPVDLRAQVEAEQRLRAACQSQLAAIDLRLDTLSHQLQKAMRRRLDDEQAAVQAEVDTLIETERKKRLKEARERQAAAMEAEAKVQKASQKKSKLQAAELVLDTNLEIQIPEDPTRERLCTPVSTLEAVRMHKKDDRAYLHMEAVRARVDALVKKEDDIWEAHDAFREMLEKEVTTQTKALETLGQDLEKCRETLAAAKIKVEATRESVPMPTLQSVEEVDGRTQFDVYDERMKAWEEGEVIRRIDFEEAGETVVEMERRLEGDPMAKGRQEIVFLEEIVKCEVERGAGLWSKKRQYQVWRTKMMLDRVEREERLVELGRSLREYSAELDHTERIPLQAMNVLERAHLESKAEQQQRFYSDKVAATMAEIEANEAARTRLMEMELQALAFHSLRLEEEALLHQETKGVYIRQKVVADSAQQDLLRSWLTLNYAREKRWRQLVSYEQIDETPWLEQDEWLVSQQRQRYDAAVTALEEKHAIQVFELEEEIAKLEIEVRLAIVGKEQSDADRNRVMVLVDEADALVETTKAETIACLKKQMDVLMAQMKAQQIDHSERIERLLAEHTLIREDLERRLDVTSADAILRMQWLKAVKCELSDHKVLNKHLLNGIAALEKRRATEINEMQARILSQLSRIHRLEMWNISLKQSIEANNDVLLQHQRNLEERVKEHRAEQRLLRHEVWRQRVSAQLLLTNAHHLLLFFLQGIAGLCGHANDALRDAAVIPILVELCKVHALPPAIRALATASLGKLAWNTPKSLRFIGWHAKTIWSTWVNLLAQEATDMLVESKVDFDDTVAPTSAEMNVLADYKTHEKVHTHLDRLHVLRETQHWISQSPIPTSLNEANILSIGDTSGALAILVELSTHATVPLEIREGAMGSLASLAMHTRNIHLMGRLPGFLSQLLQMVQEPPSRLLQVHAAHSLANLSFANRVNQDSIHALAGVDVLLRVAVASRDVDVIDLATAALSNLTDTHEAIVTHVVTSSGLTQLLTLAMASYLSDAVEDGKMDAIQGNIALCVVHVLHVSPEAVLVVWQTQPSFLGLCLRLLASGVACVQAAAIMVVGVVSQDDVIRTQLGDVGAIDLLVPFLNRADDVAIVEQTTWTLLQLSWSRDNQTRLSGYWPIWYELATRPDPKWRLAQQHVFQLVGNLVFYHADNRASLLHDETWLRLLLDTCAQANVTWRPDAVRALCALSYDNEFAATSRHMEVVATVLRATDQTDMVLHGLQWLMNLLVHDVQKSRFVHCPQATETLVMLCGAESPQVRQRAEQALDLVADIRLRQTQTWKP